MLNRFMATALMLGFLVSCGGYPKKVDEPTDTRAQAEAAAAAQLDASYVSEIEFRKNTAALDIAARESLRRLVQEARKAGKIDEIKVAVWADRPYPSVGKQKLNEKERNLAYERARAIEDYLEELEVGDIDIYNMAERPNALERLMNTSDAKVKNVLESAGLSGPGTVLNSKTSRAVVMVVLED